MTGSVFGRQTREVIPPAVAARPANQLAAEERGKVVRARELEVGCPSYSMADIDRLRRLKSLTEDMGLNLAGAEVALKLMNRIEELEGEVERLTKAAKVLQEQGQRQRPSDANHAPRPIT